MKNTWLIQKDASGKERPAVCVPIVAAEAEEIWSEGERIRMLPADLVEWRADFYREAEDLDRVVDVLRGLKERLGGKQLLFTCRTATEGGQYTHGEASYVRLCEAAAASGSADLVDVEVFSMCEHAQELIRYIREHGCRAVASNHDFEKTPPAEEMLRRLRRMEELGADAAKLAVMPRDAQDVLNLMQVTLTADRELRIPVITMSMGELGVLSRFSGRLTGSALTFASAGKASAPGQIPVEEMARILLST